MPKRRTRARSGTGSENRPTTRSLSRMAQDTSDQNTESDAATKSPPIPVSVAPAVAAAAANYPPHLQPFMAPIRQPEQGSFHVTNSFFIKAYWTKDGKQDRLGGHMYVERHDPLLIVQTMPIILIHGDWHTGQVTSASLPVEKGVFGLSTHTKVWTTKPDGGPGWAGYFIYQGYRVYIVDLPACGRSNSLTGSQVHVANQSPVPSKELIARDITATRSQTGKPDDATFERYYASLVPLLLRKVDRQRLAQSALGELLEHTGPAILIGEGTGANMAWLATDLKPNLVAHVFAVEPAGPPCGTALGYGIGGTRRFSSYIRFDPSVRAYGVADIPMQYEPPVVEDDTDGDNDRPKLDVLPTYMLHEGAATCVMQRCDENSHTRPFDPPRRLVNLQPMGHTIITSQASSHSTYDWATVKFLRQAGVRVESKRLEEYGVTGNGHLMFLEENSDEIACLLCIWITTLFPPLQPILTA
ncbi:hypothetical protein CP533_6491 [Ophiocordyceps camponoti-saundersi (nom. inval.)]|nr:hypothetical protein CP533_6491 [Ophiocordyceps camponoti-saundersi (nom. inval.)]